MEIYSTTTWLNMFYICHSNGKNWEKPSPWLEGEMSYDSLNSKWSDLFLVTTLCQKIKYTYIKVV